MKTKCPYCNYLATKHETLDEQNSNPKEGEISFCINCGKVSEYFKNNLIKVDINTLDESTQREIKDIESAWVRTRSISKLKKHKVSQEGKK